MRLEDILGLILAAVMLGVLLTILFWALWANRKRRIALARLAGTLGMQYLPSDPEGDARRALTFLRFFPHSKGHKFSQVVRGSFGGRSVEFFDCHYRQVGKSGLDSLVVMATGADFPRLAVWPEGSAEKQFVASGLARAGGFEDIDFESHEFSKRFYVTAKDRKFAYAVVTPQAMEFLMGCPQHSCIELSGGEAVASTGGQIEAEELPKHLTLLSGFLDRIPDYVWKDYAAGKVAGSAR
ncbi:MAG TPA: hypothetical protein PK280_17745 [Planctomycetota bacterium]|nr:hypothetical protein [Planctomycetota bacterium]